MIMNWEDPKTWTAPGGFWHPNFNPNIEFSMLKDFVLKFLESSTARRVRLEITEPGYAEVRLYEGAKFLGDLSTTVDSSDGREWHYLYVLALEGQDDQEFLPEETLKVLAGLPAGAD
jgi:hypothetical protein